MNATYVRVCAVIVLSCDNICFLFWFSVKENFENRVHTVDRSHCGKRLFEVSISFLNKYCIQTPKRYGKWKLPGMMQELQGQNGHSLRPEGPKIETHGRERGWSFGKGQRAPFPRANGLGVPTARRVSIIFSAQDGLSVHFLSEGELNTLGEVPQETW